MLATVVHDSQYCREIHLQHKQPAVLCTCAQGGSRQHDTVYVSMQSQGKNRSRKVIIYAVIFMTRESCVWPSLIVLNEST